MEHVRVVARIRPEPAGSRDPLCLSATSAQCVDVVEPEELRSSKSPVPRSHRCEPEKKKSFTVDGVLGPRSRQDDVYEHVRPLALSVVDGYNATVFAYGHTGSGKTHTMTGTAQEPGVTPRAVRDVFGAIESAARRESAVFLVHVSYVELYNNVFRNLLEDRHDHAPSRGKIEIRESRDSGIFLGGPPNLKVPVKSERDVRDLVAFGDRQRQYASTNCNEHSSRSHCVLTLHVESRWTESNRHSCRLGKLNLVDLAGSERVAVSGAEGETLVEAQNINLSLALLGDVLAALSRNATRPKSQSPRPPEPVPYRNSKLTHLLKDSLGGNSKTLMITNLRAHRDYYRQSLVSLMYASRARKITNATRVNVDSGATANASSLRAVSEQLDDLQSRSRFRVREREFEALCNEKASSASENARLKRELQRLGEVHDDERAKLEAQLGKVIHGRSSALAAQDAEFGTLKQRLTERIASYQKTCEQQEKEICRLRDERLVLERKISDVGATRDEVREMQTVMEAWQAQAVALQRELEHSKDLLRAANHDAAAAKKSLATTAAAGRSAARRAAVLEKALATAAPGARPALEAKRDDDDDDDALLRASRTPSPPLSATAPRRRRRRSRRSRRVARRRALEDARKETARLRARLDDTEAKLRESLAVSEELAATHGALVARAAESSAELERRVARAADEAAAAAKRDARDELDERTAALARDKAAALQEAARRAREAEAPAARATAQAVAAATRDFHGQMATVRESRDRDVAAARAEAVETFKRDRGGRDGERAKERETLARETAALGAALDASQARADALAGERDAAVAAAAAAATAGAERAADARRSADLRAAVDAARADAAALRDAAVASLTPRDASASAADAPRAARAEGAGARAADVERAVRDADDARNAEVAAVRRESDGAECRGRRVRRRRRAECRDRRGPPGAGRRAECRGRRGPQGGRGRRRRGRGAARAGRRAPRSPRSAEAADAAAADAARLRRELDDERAAEVAAVREEAAGAAAEDAARLRRAMDDARDADLARLQQKAAEELARCRRGWADERSSLEAAERQAAGEGLSAALATATRLLAEAAERREALKASLESKFAVQIEAAVKLAEVEKDREREAALSAERRSLAKDREAQLQNLQRTFLAKIHEAPREPPRERPLALENGDDFGRERRDLEFAFSERLDAALLERDRCHLAALGEKLAERDRDLAATRDDAEADAEARVAAPLAPRTLGRG
ncbi:hypothetical protein JL722_5443 [Aureococcus anophagefferens]|nr:hypothetical protein JL722_5443 [Aureococcus anophagefferens]